MIHPTEGVGFPRDLEVSMVSLIAKAQAKKNKFQTRLFFQTPKIADMIILNHDPLKLDPKDLRTLKVEKLFLHGREYKPGMGMLWNSFKGRKEKI